MCSALDYRECLFCERYLSIISAEFSVKKRPLCNVCSLLPPNSTTPYIYRRPQLQRTSLSCYKLFRFSLQSPLSLSHTSNCIFLLSVSVLILENMAVGTSALHNQDIKEGIYSKSLTKVPLLIYIC